MIVTLVYDRVQLVLLEALDLPAILELLDQQEHAVRLDKLEAQDPKEQVVLME